MATLREGIEEDRRNFNKNLPALNKLKLVDPIEKFLSNAHYQEVFLGMGGLDILQEFIKKNPDGTYPVFNQINKTLEILNKINISDNHLENSHIGAHLMNISKNLKESKQIQKKASDLIEKWTRIVYNINTNYADFESGNSNYQTIYLQRKKKRDEEIDMRPGDNIYGHARIPKKTLFDFTRKPMSKISELKTDDKIKNIHSLFNTRNKKKD
jgi:transcription factor SPN1